MRTRSRTNLDRCPSLWCQKAALVLTLGSRIQGFKLVAKYLFVIIEVGVSKLVETLESIASVRYTDGGTTFWEVKEDFDLKWRLDTFN